MLGSNEWWGVISNYNSSIFPVQILFYGVGLFAIVYHLMKSNEISNVVLKSYFAISNLWVGIMFFLVHGKELGTPQHIIQGVLFIVIGVLFAIDIFTKKINFVVPKRKLDKTIMIVLLVAVALYPAVGFAVGRDYTHVIVPGTLPCPTTALGLVLLVASLPKVNKLQYILMLIWAIPFPPLIQIPKYHVYEDSIMFVIGLYALACFVIAMIKTKKTAKQV